MRRRNNFTQRQKQEYLDANAEWTERMQGHGDGRRRYCCDSCGFTSKHRELFQVDHVIPVARGGDNDRAARDPEVRRLLQEDPWTAFQHGHAPNGQVLCEGCNRAKADQDVVPAGAGYAYRHPDMDENPRHAYYGSPDDKDHPDVRRAMERRGRRLEATRKLRAAREREQAGRGRGSSKSH